MVERFRIARDRVLGGGIERHVGHRQETEHGANVDDATILLAAHMRHDSPGHPDYPKEVRIEDRLGLLDRALFRTRWSDPEAGVIDEKVNAAFQLHHLLDSSIDRFLLGHVEGQHLERSLTGRGYTPTGSVHLIASLREALRGGLADA